MSPLKTQPVTTEDIPISKIKVINRMRKTDINTVADIAQSINEVGQIHEITVCRKGDEYILICGNHRVEAMRLLKKEYIRARIREDQKLINQLIELEENLCARRNNSIEEAEAIILREQILIQLGRKAVVGNNQYTEEKITNDDLAKQLGYTRRTYQYKKSIANLHPEVKDLLGETKFANNMMDMHKLQKLPDHIQLEIANLLITDKAKTFRRAYVLAHLKFNQTNYPDDIQRTKDTLGLSKSVMHWERKKNKLNDICYYVSHNEDNRVNRMTGQFGTNEINNYTMLPEQSSWFVQYFSNEGDLVIDNFAGRGTNIIAAAYHNRRVIGYDLSPTNLQLIRTACLENTSIKEEDLTLHHSCGVEMVEYAEATDIADLLLLDPPYYGAEVYGNDERDLCHIKDVAKFNARFKTCLINMKRLIKPSSFKDKVFKPIIIKCGSIRRGSRGLVEMKTEIEILAREVGLVLHDVIINELRSAYQSYNVGRSIEDRYTIKSHETNLVFLKYES